jgi:hypothetical protein
MPTYSFEISMQAVQLLILLVLYEVRMKSALR